MHYQNPIVPGFYPDPSICRAGKDYYLVTSTFEYFPGVPIFHSTDLVNWTQIGHCLSRASQLDLSRAGNSAGIYAPTIRYNNGIFYMVTTNVCCGNFYVYTDNPADEWSEPIFVEQGGIDPSLFFDDDGKVYFTSTTDASMGISGIMQSEIDIKTGKLLTDPKFLWSGAGGRYPEAPHLFKIDNTYYLMAAEGGTEYGHMETISRSSSPWGPFESCPNNPILTHKNRCHCSIDGTGHADFVETENGDWWVVFLAFRTTVGQYHHLGRETFLAPVTWEKDRWPVINSNGTVDFDMESDKIAVSQVIPSSEIDNFDDLNLGYKWNFITNPRQGMYSLEERKGYLRLYGSEVSLNDTNSPSFIGRRQQHLDCKASILIDFYPEQNGEEAGLAVLIDKKHHYEIAVVGDNAKRKIIVRQTIGTLSAIVAEEEIQAGSVTLEIKADRAEYKFAYALDNGASKELAIGETKYLSSEVAGGFTGVYFGLYATGNGKKSNVPADFDWFKYEI